ncbi:hypothetical protein [Lactococcus kimchii]|uniref:hypothetical protein n=1 Tax=Lactococcus sp. S-13 TaxID=2507158 RepID=UPI001022EF51|nr:hypothetical protein [Lactococcus sp. S-13]RZI49219.1 hypothetical protein EQJ87_07065 [Lactococcus sp. S-13]
MNAKKVKIGVLSLIAILALVSLSFSMIKGAKAGTDSDIPTYSGVGNGGALSVQIGAANYPYNIADSSLSATQARMTGQKLTSSASATDSAGNSLNFNASYNSGLSTSDGNITTSNIKSVIQALDLTINGVALTQYVKSPIIVNGIKYSGFLESAEGATIPYCTILVNDSLPMNIYNASSLFMTLPGFDYVGDGNQGVGAMADFKMSTSDFVRGATNWIGLSNLNQAQDQINITMSGHDITLSGKTNFAGLGNVPYEINLDIETKKETNATEPGALDFHVTTTRAKINGASVDSSLVLNTIYKLVQNQNTNNFMTYTGGDAFDLDVEKMPGGANLYENDNYGNSTWKNSRILVAVNWTTGTFYYDYPDGSGSHNVPIVLDN